MSDTLCGKSSSHSAGAGQVIGYVRVSSVDQNPERQRRLLAHCDRVFEDHMSGSSRKPRVQLEELVRYVRDGDEVQVVSMDRLGRNTRDLYSIMEEITDKGASVRFLSEDIVVSKDATKPVQSLMLSLLAGIAEFERSQIRERQAAGIAAAKARGVYERTAKMTPEKVALARERIGAGVPKAVVARDLGVSRQTLYVALQRANGG